MAVDAKQIRYLRASLISSHHDHLRRLRRSEKVMRFDAGYPEEHLIILVQELIRANRVDLSATRIIFICRKREHGSTCPPSTL